MSQHRARARQLVVGVPGRVGAPGRDPAELLAGQGVQKIVLPISSCGVASAHHLLLDAQVAQRLHRALVGDVRTRGVRQPAVLGHQERVGAVGGEEEGRRCAGRAGAHDQDIGADVGLDAERDVHRRTVIDILWRSDCGQLSAMRRPLQTVELCQAPQFSDPG